jgi:hypothetical protein
MELQFHPDPAARMKFSKFVPKKGKNIKKDGRRPTGKDKQDRQCV